jgi:hypothetical protein
MRIVNIKMSEIGRYTNLSNLTWDNVSYDTWRNSELLYFCKDILWKTYGSGNQKKGMVKLWNMFNTDIRSKLDDVICNDFPRSTTQLIDSNGDLRNITNFFYRNLTEEDRDSVAPDNFIRPEKKPTRLPRILSELQKEYIINVLNNTIRILNHWNEFPNFPERNARIIKKNIEKCLNATNEQIDFITQL